MMANLNLNLYMQEIMLCFLAICIISCSVSTLGMTKGHHIIIHFLVSLSPSSKFSKLAVCDVTKGPLTGLFHVSANTFKQPLGLKHLDLVPYLPNMSNKTSGPKHRAKAVASFTRWVRPLPWSPR